MNLFKVIKPKPVMIFILFCSIAFLLAIADRAPIHLEKNCPCIHFTEDMDNFIRGVTQSTSHGPYVYRIFIPYLVAGIHSVIPFLSYVNIDLLLKIFFLILCQVTFFYYLRNFFPEIISLTGVFILDILLSFTFSSILGPSIGENNDLLNMAVFTLALISLYKNSFFFFMIILFIGTFNRETTWFLIPILFFNDLISKRKLYRTLFAFIAVAVPYFGLRMIIQPPVSDWFLFESLERNIPFLSSELTTSALIANAHTLFLLGPLIILSLINFKKNPNFLQAASYITPLFIILHYIFGSIIETRLWLPLFILLIPLSLTTLNVLFNPQPASSNFLHVK
jgi:hypothetical protein